MFFVIIFVELFRISFGVIYHLNSTEYKRLPPLYTLDVYEPCVSDPGGVYCVTQFELYWESENNLTNLIQEYSEVTYKHYNHSKIQKGICVSKSCDVANINLNTNEDLHTALEECINDTIWKEYGVYAKIDHVFNCDKQNDKPHTDLLDWSIAAVCTVIIVINFIGTYYDYVRKKYEGTIIKHVFRYMSCFSLQRNFRALIDKAQSSTELKWHELHGMRTVATLLVVYVHVTLLVASFTEDPHTFEKAFDSKFFVLIFSALLLVQIFMFLTGFLLAYSLQAQTDNRAVRWSLVPKFIVLRWWRLTPAYALMIGVMMTWLRLLGSGPLWQMHVGACFASCRQYWWSHLLYINNYIKDNRLCAFQTWYLAADMQLGILGLIIHVATRHRARSLVLGITVLVGMAVPAVHVWLYDLDGQAVLTPEFYRTVAHATYQMDHIRGHSNIPCFVIGMATGYLAHGLKKRGTDLSGSKICRLLCWLVIPGQIAVLYNISKVFSDSPRDPLATRMLQAATHRTVLGVLYTIWTLGILLKCNDVSRALFSWRGWRVTSKLSYCVYLIHVSFIHIIYGLRKELIAVSFSYVVSMAFLVLVLSFLAAVPLHLMVEVPVIRLMKLIFVNQFRPKHD